MISFLIAETAAVTLFLWAAWARLKESRARLVEFLAIFFYGLILEELDMKFFGTYHYGEGFRLMVFNVPVSIALLWAVIISGAMAISDRSGLPETARPFFDALLAVWIDLSLDAIAIRAGFWSWAIPLDQGWFGVPAGNLYAWMWVAFFYSVLARALRILIVRRPAWVWGFLALPFAAYLLLFTELWFVGKITRLAGFVTPNERLWIFAAHFFVFSAITVWNWRERKPGAGKLAVVWPFSRHLLHLFFFALFWTEGIWRELPALGLISLAVWAADTVLMKKVPA